MMATLEEARAGGLSRYFTGNPCRRGLRAAVQREQAAERSLQ